jgi:surface antigen
VSASRKVVEELLEEVKITREQIPGILKDVKPITKQVENTAKQLPEIIDPVLDEVSKTRETIPDILEEIRKTNITIEKAVLEVRQTREAIPGMMDRADQIVLSAKDAGKEAGKGVISGIVGGVISMPGNVVGGVKKGATSLLSPQDREDLTTEDMNLLQSKLLELVNKGEVGQVATWKNKNSSNSGKITIEEKYKENGKECCKVKIDIYLNRKEPRTRLLKGCQQPDGTWIVNQGSISDK